MKLRNDYRERTRELSVSWLIEILFFTLHDVNQSLFRWQEKLNSLERELEMRRADARELKEENEEKNQKIQMINDQLQKVKADCASRFTSELESIHRQNRELKAQVSEMEYKLSQSKKESTAAVEASRGERERAEVRLIAEVESLKGRMSSLKEERNRIEKLRQGADSKCSVYSLQIQQLTRDLADVKELLVEREHACEDADRKVSELSGQLTIALSKQQQFYRQEREMRTSLERLIIDKTRMEREVSVRCECLLVAAAVLLVFDTTTDGLFFRSLTAVPKETRRVSRRILHSALSLTQSRPSGFGGSQALLVRVASTPFNVRISREAAIPIRHPLPSPVVKRKVKHRSGTLGAFSLCCWVNLPSTRYDSLLREAETRVCSSEAKRVGEHSAQLLLLRLVRNVVERELFGRLAQVERWWHHILYKQDNPAHPRDTKVSTRGLCKSPQRTLTKRNEHGGGL